ncbi:MAG: hypothetical protein ACE14S_00505 [Candidatus Bathyarchaeia archaeon]
MPWEETEQLIRSGHRESGEFQEDTLKTITLSEEEGIKAVIGKPKGKHTMEIRSYLFEKNKGWTLEKAKEWFQKHHQPSSHERIYAVMPFEIREKILEKPLRVRGIALTAGMSRNFNVYTPEELQSFASKLVNAPMYLEHVAAPSAVGKVTKTEWDGEHLWYEAEVLDEETAEKIRKGLIRHVSIGADYETLDFLSGKVPHGLHNAEISLVAVPGIPEANVQIIEKPHLKNSLDPAVAGDFVLGFQQDTALFLPEHFSTVWLDRENGVLAFMGRLREQPETQRTQAIFFLREKGWDQSRIQDWLTLHPDYTLPAPSQTSTVERLVKKPAEPTISVDEAVHLIESALPTPLVQRSWSLGPQRMCQELRRIILKLQSKQSHNDMTASSRG